MSKVELNSALKTSNSREELKTPPLKCKNFSGENDRFHFRSFLFSFENVSGCRRDLFSGARLQYLKSNLSEFVLYEIESLSNINENYPVAMQILRVQYLDVPFFIDSL